MKVLFIGLNPDPASSEFYGHDYPLVEEYARVAGKGDAVRDAFRMFALAKAGFEVYTVNLRHSDATRTPSRMLNTNVDDFVQDTRRKWPHNVYDYVLVDWFSDPPGRLVNKLPQLLEYNMLADSFVILLPVRPIFMTEVNAKQLQDAFAIAAVPRSLEARNPAFLSDIDARKWYPFENPRLGLNCGCPGARHALRTLTDSSASDTSFIRITRNDEFRMRR